MQRRLAAIVHADLAGFTRMMEGAETRTFRHLKSAQIEVWRPAIDAGSGRLVGTAGDAMLAEFGSAVTAVGAAIDIQERMARFNEALAVEQRMLFRVGVHLGEVIVDEEDQNIFGDGVNLAARLEALNKQYGTTILVSGAVAAAVGDEFALRRLDRVAVKGKSQGVDVFELLGYATDSSSVAGARRYEAALDAYFARDFAAAIALLDGVTDDPPSALLRERCLALRDEPPPPDWNGVHAATTK